MWQGHESHRAEVTESFGGAAHELVCLHSLDYSTQWLPNCVIKAYVQTQKVWFLTH